jgi:hypothetical protein
MIMLVLLKLSAAAKATDWEDDALPLHRAQKALTDVVVHDIFSPPVASRIYAYTNIAAHEVLVKNGGGYRSFYMQLNGFPQLPMATENVCFSLAAVHAFLLVGKSLVFSEAMLQDSAVQILQWYDDKKISPQEYKASLEYGGRIATAVIQWAGTDQYRETRRVRRYNYLKQEGKWIPTPPVYMAAVEPYWNRIRLMVLDSCTQFRPDPPIVFSTEKASVFYQQAMEVHGIVLNITAAQKAIANFWDCNPFAVSTEGHLNFATKKISPGGHWISITGIACRREGAGMAKTAAAYALVAVALYDAFIICWDEKYRSNVIRPETYINKYIDESWRPLLQTPPFPEYTSGHSVISTVAAHVLTGIFGNMSYCDNTEVDFGLPVKHFRSFTQACNEAAISRLYGGIHYRAAIEAGQKQGLALAEYIVGKIRLAP